MDFCIFKYSFIIHFLLFNEGFVTKLAQQTRGVEQYSCAEWCIIKPAVGQHWANALTASDTNGDVVMISLTDSHH